MNGVTLDHFKIEQRLGEGKFGSVFLAREKVTGFLVALKIIEKKRVIEEKFLTQFIREIKIQAYLDHPNIAKVFGFFQDATNFYSIMELGEGGQLYDIIKNG
jgi:serine/threonine protein kinase